MNEIGELLRSTRESAGVSLEEASSDLDIKPLILENIENGNIGCFKDIFLLKDNLSSYSKYLGLDSKKIIDDFNDYLFEYTSKIPVSDIEKAIMEKKKEEKKEEKVVSPYTTPVRKKSKFKIVIGIIIGLLIIALVVWAVSKITIENSTTNTVSYVN